MMTFLQNSARLDYKGRSSGQWGHKQIYFPFLNNTDLIRIGCDDEGYPITEDTTTTPAPAKSPRDPVSGKDIKRAEEKVPRGHYKGVDFSEMSDILNGWLNSSTLTKPCLDWDVAELQQLQALFYLARYTTQSKDRKGQNF